MVISNNPIDANFHSGFVAIIGRPNVGKSTLLNAILGQKVAAVSPRPQTTRQRQLGILTLPHAQIVFIDTPGIHVAHHALSKAMNAIAQETLQEVDVIVWIVDSSQPPSEEDEIIAAQLSKLRPSPYVILALNKIDLLEGDRLAKYEQQFLLLLKNARPMEISALSGFGLADLQAALVDEMPEGEPLYSADQVTDFFERQIASDLIREAALINLRDEVPHALAVRVDEYKEREEQGAYIAATLFIEKDSQKGIVIGRGGEMLKKIGTQARQSIEEMSGRKVFLELRVKVSKNWRNNPDVLRQMGFDIKGEG
jgi:GTP-binding protein Era